MCMYYSLCISEYAVKTVTSYRTENAVSRVLAISEELSGVRVVTVFVQQIY